MKKHGIPLFERRIFADISRLYHRFRLALDDVNYKNQVFYWEDGKLYRAFLDGEAVFTEEFLYIHFSGRKLGKADFDEEAAMAFFISPEGFCLKEKGCPSKTEILTNNRFPGKIQEAYERNRAKLIFKWKRLKSRI